MPRPPLAVGTFGAINFLVVGKGRVRAQVSFRDFDGRRRSVSRYGRTKAEAERRLRAALRDRGNGLDEGASADSRLATVAAAWLAEVDDSDLAVGTKRLYRFAVQNYVIPGVGQLRLREITVPAVDRLLTAVRKSHGAGAAKAARSVLSGILTEAVRRGAIPTNPVREVASRRAHRRPAPGPRALTVEEARQLCERLAADAEAVELDLPDLVEFMLGTGVRIGEACALRWSAVDLVAATVRIDATLIRVPGRGPRDPGVPQDHGRSADDRAAGLRRRPARAPAGTDARGAGHGGGLPESDRATPGSAQHEQPPAPGPRSRRLRLGQLARVPQDRGDPAGRGGAVRPPDRRPPGAQPAEPDPGRLHGSRPREPGGGDGAPAVPLSADENDPLGWERARLRRMFVVCSSQRLARLALQAADLGFCSPDWTRTNNPAINSRMLCQLSYGG